MPTLRHLLFVALAIPAVLWTTSPAAAQDAAQKQPSTASTPNPAVPPPSPTPQPMSLPSLQVKLPNGFRTFNADCFTVNPSNGGVVTLTLNGSQGCLVAGTLTPSVTFTVLKREELNTVLTSIETTGDQNYQNIQKAVLGAIVQVLSDQSIKADQVAAAIKTAADQITNDVTQAVQKNLTATIQAEVTHQLKEIKNGSKQTSVKSTPASAATSH